MTISCATNLLYTPPWQPIMHFNWTSSSRHCFSAAEIFHFGLIRIHSNARNSISSIGSEEGLTLETSASTVANSNYQPS